MRNMSIAIKGGIASQCADGLLSWPMDLKIQGGAHSLVVMMCQQFLVVMRQRVHYVRQPSKLPTLYGLARMIMVVLMKNCKLVMARTNILFARRTLDVAQMRVWLQRQRISLQTSGPLAFPITTLSILVFE
jgi:hypothetical protein